MSLRRERFEKIAAKRVQKLLDAMELLSNCSNKRNYEYSEEDVRKMMKAIKDKLHLLEISFRSGTEKENSNQFRF